MSRATGFSTDIEASSSFDRQQQRLVDMSRKIIGINKPIRASRKPNVSERISSPRVCCTIW